MDGTDLPWDHLRTFDVVAREGSLSAAARVLGVSQSTVSRHMAQLERAAGVPLWTRGGAFALTERGAALAKAVGPMVAAAIAARAAIAPAREVQGWVTLATLPELLRWTVVPRLSTLLEAHPKLVLRLLADNRTVRLAADEADLALRLGRPSSGNLVARRLTEVRFGIYAGEGLAIDEQTPWLGYTGSLARIPEQQAAERLFAARPLRLVVEDVESLAQAVGDGLGIAILPRPLAKRFGLTAIGERALGVDGLDLPARAVWLVAHRTKRRIPQVAAVWRWLVDAFASGLTELLPK